MGTQRDDHGGTSVLGSPQRRRMLMWLVLSVFAALLGYFAFRGYLTPELLFHFAGQWYC